ncbi:PTS glucose transporter subunit IIA [Sphaerisporangium melleum]|uniref:PTS glucose transporter subunit IIA n=1 Tax=Sphaerisporangium melleum TaxID=321316 RepID=A0A917QRD0_9ACTN|nr:PTS glucose transporter subunit IIA [Sphaerisporangium melleum]GGK64641.1 PTS glucose transporter subunit IIA [Sphaerisporangium melleum]GII70052.1 PTS glucose transporter subunit IIA [Sphaerisporangium melleum]
MTTVLAPVAGHVVGLAGVPDPVFSGGLVGPGTAIDPARRAGEALAPIDGLILKLHPHAYVIAGEDGRAVLVHLGIDTVLLKGEGFRPLACEGARVRAGAPVVAWDPVAVASAGKSPICPVVALDARPGTLTTLLAAGPVRAGEELFRWGGGYD